MIFIKLFLAFFKTGLFSIGGGLATLPFLKEISVKNGWYTLDEFMNMIAVSESTPGPIGVNMATYAGFNTAGFMGAILATIGLVVPSVIVVILVSRGLSKFKGNKIVKSIFYTLRPASVGLISGALFDIFMVSFFRMDEFLSDGELLSLFKFKCILFFVVAFVILGKKPKIHPICFIAAGALFGVIFKF